MEDCSRRSQGVRLGGVRGFQAWVTAGMMAWTTLNAAAQLPLARLTTVFPPGAQCGTTQEVVLQGTDLDDASALWFSEPRMAAIARPGNPLTWEVVVPPEVAPGRVDLRVVGRFGMSNPRGFVLGGVREQTLDPTNLSAATASVLPVDVTVNGRVPAGAALWFALPLEAGQRVVLQLAGRELDSRLDPVLTLLDAARVEVESSRRGGLAFTAPSAGTWLVKVHDITYRGGDEYAFRLVASSGPQIEFAWPPAVQPGRTNRVLLLGRHLPGSSMTHVRGADGHDLESLEVEVVVPGGSLDAVRPAGARLASAAVSGWRWTPPSTWGAVAPLWFAWSDETNRVIAPIEQIAVVQTTVPCEAWGLCAPRGLWGGVRFPARKGEVWWVEVQSERLGFPTDASLVIQRATGGDASAPTWVDVVDFQDQDTNFGSPGYNTQTRDPAGRFEVPEDAEYRVVVRDLFRLSPVQPRFPYRLSVRAESPGFALAAHPVMPPPPDPNQRPMQPWVTFLRRGETLPVRVLAFRRDGFAGEIELGAEGLPPGVVAPGAKILAGQNVGTLLFQAAEDAASWSGVVRVVGHAQAGGRELTSTAVAASVMWGVGDYNLELATSRWTDGFGLAVSGVESAPVVIKVADAKALEAVEQAKLTIPLRVLRRGEFSADLKLKATGHPELEKLGELTVSGSSTQAVLEIALSERKLAPGAHTFFLQALTPGKYRNQPEAVAVAEAELKAAEQALSSVTAEEKPKAEAARKAAEERKKAAEERAKPRDVQVAVYSRPITLRIQAAPKP